MVQHLYLILVVFPFSVTLYTEKLYIFIQYINENSFSYFLGNMIVYFLAELSKKINATLFFCATTRS